MNYTLVGTAKNLFSGLSACTWNPIFIKLMR